MKIPLADLIRKLRANKVGQGDNPPLGSDKLTHSALESFAFKQFQSMATNGPRWRFSLSKAHYFNWLIHSFGKSLPVIKKWNAFKELPQIKKNLYKEVEAMEGVIYE